MTLQQGPSGKRTSDLCFKILHFQGISNWIQTHVISPESCPIRTFHWPLYQTDETLEGKVFSDNGPILQGHTPWAVGSADSRIMAAALVCFCLFLGMWSVFISLMWPWSHICVCRAVVATVELEPALSSRYYHLAADCCDSAAAAHSLWGRNTDAEAELMHRISGSNRVVCFHIESVYFFFMSFRINMMQVMIWSTVQMISENHKIVSKNDGDQMTIGVEVLIHLSLNAV